MGFVRRTYAITFEGNPEVDGLKLSAKPMNIDRTIGLITLKDRINVPGWTDDHTKAMHAAADALASVITEWNLENDDGTPVPVTGAELCDSGFKFLFAVLDGYLNAITSVPDPLGQASSGGGQSEEPSIPMETLSPSPAS